MEDPIKGSAGVLLENNEKSRDGRCSSRSSFAQIVSGEQDSDDQVRIHSYHGYRPDFRIIDQIVEMVLELIVPFLIELITGPVKQYVVWPISRHVGYAFKCNSNVQTLQDDVEQLKNKKDRLQHSVDGAIRDGEEIYSNVTKWLSSVDKAVGDAEELVQQKEEAKKRCLVGLCPNFKSRYQLSKNARKKASTIDKLRNEEGLDSISFKPMLQQIVEPSVYSREALPSRVLILNQIMDALGDPNVNMIGVYGMGGVGKTTLAKEVQAKAVEEKLFETVVVVAVSQTIELKRIQAEIAVFLGLKFDIDELSGRASQLYRRLENSKVLIILDDLWQKLDLNAVGIPFGGASKGCKIVVTSRNMDLLSNEMRAQKLFSLEVLKEEETWSLFEMFVAEAKDPKFHAMATEIAKKCAGLPLLILIVATELQNKESYEWNDKLNQLSTFGDEEIYEKVYKVLESSYENLPGKEAKLFFLLCALFGQSNIQIQYLLTHSLGLGLFKHIRTIEGARDKVLTLIRKLKAKSLLSDGDIDGCVKMHDIVRDTALSIASRVQHAYIGTKEVGFRDWPNKNCTRMSLPDCHLHELPVGLDCPEAELFLLFTEDLCLEIPDSFFEGIGKLKVVDLTGMRLVSLPSSIGLLTNLKTLCLHRCRLDNVALVGELKQLEFLSFANSKILELPREIEALNRLKLLDLRNCSDLQVIPENVLSKLCSLEELYMLNSFVRWGANGNVRLEELGNLSQLSTLEIQIVNPKLIPKSGCRLFDGLRSYKISIGSTWNWAGKYETSRTLKLRLEAGVNLEDGIEVLLRGAEDLYLEDERGTKSVLYDLDREGFPQLKHLYIQNDYDSIQHLIKSTMRASCHAFPILESLFLHKLNSLEKICDGQLENGSFAKLRMLRISKCNKLKSLFPFSFAKCLPQLQEMEVESCDNLEAIVGEDGRYNNEVIEFTELTSLKLKFLPKLTGFCKKSDGTALLTEMGFFPNLTSLEVSRCKSLKCVFTASTVKRLMELKKLEISNCELVEEIVQSKKKLEEIEEGSNNVIVFPKLDYLSLSFLPNVKCFGCGYPIEFPLLRELNIDYCGAMENFVSKDSDRSNNNESSDEYLFNEMVTLSNMERVSLDGLNNLRYLWHKEFTADDDSFSKLKTLRITNCSKLSVVFPSEVYRRFLRLEVLHVSHCNRVEEVYQYQNQGTDLKEINNVEAFLLRDLRIESLPSLKNIWGNNPYGAFIFENLQAVQVSICKDLKYVFPTSIVSGLLQLQQLRISYCNFSVLIGKEQHESSEGSPCFTFPQLTILELNYLEEMRSLYEESHTSELPKLKCLEVCGCHQISKSRSKISSYHQENEQRKDIAPIQQSLFSAEMSMSNLEELTFDHQGFLAITRGEFLVGFFSKLKKVTLQTFNQDYICFLFGFLRRHCSLQMLHLSFCNFNEIFSLDDEKAVGEEQHIYHLRLKHLELKFIQNLKHIMIKKDSQLNPLLQFLQTLNIKYCNDLINIAPCLAYFKNLTTLKVERCDKITSLVTASTAKTMVQLMELRVFHCKMIEEIVSKDDGDCTEEHDEIVFNKLKCLELTDLDMLKSFCSGNYAFCFPMLENVIVQGCSRMEFFCGGDLSTPKLKGIQREYEQQWEGNLNMTITCQLKKWVGGQFEEGELFRNVESLEVAKDAFASKAILADQLHFLNKLREINVRDCTSVQVVFDLEGLFAAEGGYVGLLSQLNELNLVNLPVLSKLCNKSPKGILDFNKLKVLKIVNCSRLDHVFTWSMASCLFHLQEIHVRNCEMMESMLKEEGEEDAAAQVIFGSLETIDLEYLPKFSNIYSGSGDLECPSLKKISVRMCPTIKSFISRLTKEDREGKEECNLIHFSHKVFPKLEELTLDIKSITAILKSELPANFFSEVKNLKLGYYFTTKSHVPLAQFLLRLPNVVELGVCNSSLEELFKFEGLNSNMEEVARTLQQIRALKLENLNYLKQIWWQNSQLHASLFQSLETLEVKSCGNLIDLASSSASFQNLTTLSVNGCNKLRNLITSSVAKSMTQLERLRVQSCKMLMEIVADRNDGTTDEIVFTKMKTLELVDLQSLGSFCLGHCAFKFPCLEHVVLRRCPNLNIFCAGIITAPMLDCVKLYNCEGDLNAATQQLYMKMDGFQDLREVRLSKFPILREKWAAQVHFKYFHSLEKLVVDYCELFSNAIPLHLLQYLKRLKVLIVGKCDLVEQVFDLEGLNAHKKRIEFMKNLIKLQLIDLPRLKHVWIKDPQQILSFENLQFLQVYNCGSLTFIFNVTMASSLPSLQHVEVKNSSSVKHILLKEEEEAMQEYQTIFPSLHSMSLQNLTNLSSFCSTSGFLECPSLKMIEVVKCPNMESFASTFSNEQDPCMIVEETDLDPMARFLGGNIAIPGLEKLKIEWNSLKDKLYGEDQPEFLSRLKGIELTGFHGEEYAILPFLFLHHFPKLERLALSDALIEEINIHELSIVEGIDKESVALLTKFKLSNLPKLKHLVQDDCQSVPVFRDLEDLEVLECSRLKILVPSSVSFQNLTNLYVSKCDGLINLITASTARSLVQLRRMNVKDCKMMQEILAIASDGVDYEIRFSQLEYLALENLACLTSFCSGNYAFHFPSLAEVIVTGCPNMKIFSEQVPAIPKLQKVKTSKREYEWEWEWEGSLNNTIQSLLMEKDAEETVA